MAKTMANAQVGRSVPRLESRRKVTGEIEYTHAMTVPGMLYGKIFRSTVAHGKIVRIDVSEAAALPGVHAVLTGADICKLVPSPYYGPAFHDQPVLALEKVRYIGEPVAIVLSTDPHIAEEATGLILAEYDELPAVFNEVEAMTSSAIVHDVLKPAGTFPDLKHLEGRSNTNVALDFVLKKGDVERGFADADYVLEHTFQTQPVMHTPLEPMVSLAIPGDRTVAIHTASQSPSFVRSEVARLLGWPENRVHVRAPYLGGGFGAKLYIKLEALVACCALIVRRPVKVSLTMEEQFYTITKHASTFRIKSGVRKDGRIIARQCEVWWNGGAYADIGPRVTQKSGFTSAGPYDIENVHIDSYACYTNLPPAGAFRGFGIPQLVWAYESHTDLIARELEIDPVAFRRKNLLREGDEHATGTIMKDAAIELVLDRVVERMQWNAPFERPSGTIRRGRGVAVGYKASISPTTSGAIVTINGDGSVTLACGTVDMGQGSDTAMAALVGEVLGIATESVFVIHSDTDIVPYDMATLGSRSTFHMGNAVRLAAEDAAANLLALAAQTGGVDAATLRIDGGTVVGLPGGALSFGAVLQKKYKMQAGNIVGFGTFIPTYTPVDHATGRSTDATPFWMTGGTGAEVEVDTETGHVRITKLINVVDCGTPLNPKIVETQISGAAIMQIGQTMFERMDYDAGQLTNASLADYKIPSFLDLADTMENEAVDAVQHSGPFGAKGIGESATFGVSPAIANAIHDAVGVRVHALPLTPETVYRAMRAATAHPLEEN